MFISGLIDRYYHCAHDDNDQHGSTRLSATHLLREGHRYLFGYVLRLRLCGITGVRGCELHVLGREIKEESKAPCHEARNDGSDTPASWTGECYIGRREGMREKEEVGEEDEGGERK